MTGEQVLEVFGGWYLASLLLGLLVGLGLGWKFDLQWRDRLYRRLSALTLGVLLPVHVILSGTKSEAFEGNLTLGAFFLGGLVSSLAILLVGWIVTERTGLRTRYAPHYKFIASTFAGGGRSIFILTILASLLSASLAESGHTTADLIAWLAVFDVGYWLFYIVVVYDQLMPRLYSDAGAAGRQKSSPDKPPFNWWTTGALTGSAFIAIVGSSTGWLHEAFASAALDVDRIRLAFACAIIGLSTLALGVKVRRFRLEETVGDMGILTVVRLAGLAVPTALAVALFPGWTLVTLVLGLTFLLSPPSSLIDRMLYWRGAEEREVQHALSLNITWNALLLAVGLGLLAVNLIRTWIT